MRRFVFSLILIAVLGCAGTAPLDLDRRSDQSDLQRIGQELVGKSFALGNDLRMEVVHPFRYHVRYHSGRTYGDFRYGGFRQTGTDQATLMCPSLGNVTFRLRGSAIDWQLDAVARDTIQNTMRARVRNTGTENF